MPVLNNVKGVYRGSALVAFVCVGSRVIWQARKVVGWKLIAGPVAIDGTSEISKRLEFNDEASVSALQVLAQHQEMAVGKPGGGAIEVVDKEISDKRVRVFLPARPKDYRLGKGDSVAFYQPIWG